MQHNMKMQIASSAQVRSSGNLQRLHARQHGSSVSAAAHCAHVGMTEIIRLDVNEMVQYALHIEKQYPPREAEMSPELDAACCSCRPMSVPACAVCASCATAAHATARYPHFQ